METKEIVKQWNRWLTAIEEGTAILLCESCKKWRKMTNPRQITIRICDKCMEGVIIPTF